MTLYLLFLRTGARLLVAARHPLAAVNHAERRGLAVMDWAVCTCLPVGATVEVA